MNEKWNLHNNSFVFAPLRLCVSQNPKALRFVLLALIVLGLTAMPQTASAQSPLSASVDRTAITTDDTVTLSVVVMVAGSPRLRWRQQATNNRILGRQYPLFCACFVG